MASTSHQAFAFELAVTELKQAAGSNVVPLGALNCLTEETASAPSRAQSDRCSPRPCRVLRSQGDDGKTRRYTLKLAPCAVCAPEDA